MKKTSSAVWQFFDRLEENKRCVAVLCKLCDTEFKYFGNTTNLRVHLAKKHPIQWDMRENTWAAPKTFDESIVQQANVIDDDQTTETQSVKFSVVPYNNSKYQGETLDVSNVSIMEESEIDQDTDASIKLVHQTLDNDDSEEEWLEEDYPSRVDIYEPKTKRIKIQSKKIKRESLTPPPSQNYYKNISTKTPKTEHYIIDESHKDEYSVFGEYIANKLRKFKASRTRGNVQQLITTILWQAECGMYDDVDSVKKMLLNAAQLPQLHPVSHQGVAQTSQPFISIGVINQNSAMEATEEITG